MLVPKLEIKNVTKTFISPGKPGMQALNPVSLFVRDNEIVSLIGSSGCGKSTLLDIVSGLTLPDSGEVFLDGRLITGERGCTSYMPQKDVLFPWRTILDNVIIALEINGVNKNAAREEARSMLPVFGLEHFANSFPYALSGGMRQRASFLRTYLCKKELMLLDEPFGKLDALTRIQMQHWLLSIWQKFKHTVLFVTHDVDEAILLSDRIYVLSPRPGQVIAEMEVNLSRPRDLHTTTSEAFTATRMNILNLLGEFNHSAEVNTSV